MDSIMQTRIGEFTNLSISAKKELNDFFSNFHSREEVMSLIDEFKNLPADGKGRPELSILIILTRCNNLTGYTDKYGKKRLCEDRTSVDSVNKAAEKYKEFAKCLPNNEQMDLIFYEKFLEIYENYKSSDDYITRLVRNRMNSLNPELIKENDSTRLLILKQFLKSFEFPRITCMTHDFKNYIIELTNLRENPTEKDINDAIASLTEDVFKKLDELSKQLDEAKQDYEIDKSNRSEINEEYKKVKKRFEDIKNKLDSQSKDVKKLFENVRKEYEKSKRDLKKAANKVKNEKKIYNGEKENGEPQPSKYETIAKRYENAKTEYTKIQELYSDKETEYKKAEKELANIENQYIDKQGKYQKAQQAFLKAQQELKIASAKCSISRNEYREFQKKCNEKWEPLIWANDIASSTFNSQQTTRNKLYWFAIIFKMTYYIGMANEEYDKDTDIQQKLFYEYYTDNLLNNLMNKDSTMEKEPTGHGINFKNFAEVIYLYYIHQNNLSAREKLCGARKMIASISKKNSDEILLRQIEKHKDKDTLFYEPLIRRVMGLTKDELETFITENYICKHKDSVPIHASSGNISAGNIYKQMIIILQNTVMTLANQQYIDDEITAADNDGDKLLKNYALSYLKSASNLFTDVYGFCKDDSLKVLIEKIREKFTVVYGKTTLNECIKSTFLPNDDAEKYVSRTKMIILYYFIFILQSVNEGEKFKSFSKFYETFCNKFYELNYERCHDKQTDNLKEEHEWCYKSRMIMKQNDRDFEPLGINDILFEAGYQEINPKNIFDIIVIFFAFKHHKKMRYSNISKGDEED